MDQDRGGKVKRRIKKTDLLQNTEGNVNQPFAFDWAIRIVFLSEDVPGLVKKSAPHFGEALLLARRSALINLDKLRIAGADGLLRKCEAIHINRDPAAVHKHEVSVPD